MPVRFDDIGDRLKAFRLSSGLTVEEITKNAQISRAALYRYERGEVAKIETLVRLADLLGVSIETLMGVGVEYLSSAVAFFERMRQIEETVDQIVVLFGPVSYLLTSSEYDKNLKQVLTESIPANSETQIKSKQDIELVMRILARRKEQYFNRKPGIVSIVSASEMERFLRNGMVGNTNLSKETRQRRRAFAVKEAERVISILEDEPIGVQLGVVEDTVPQSSFQIFSQPDRPLLAVSPFRLGENPNIRVGVAMITPAHEAVTLHKETARELWSRSVKGKDAAFLIKKLIKNIMLNT